MGGNPTPSDISISPYWQHSQILDSVLGRHTHRVSSNGLAYFVFVPLSSPSVVTPDLPTSFYCTLTSIGGQANSEKDSFPLGNTFHRNVTLRLSRQMVDKLSKA